jgi:hypothetical protein
LGIASPTIVTAKNGQEAVDLVVASLPSADVIDVERGVGLPFNLICLDRQMPVACLNTCQPVCLPFCLVGCLSSLGFNPLLNRCWMESRLRGRSGPWKTDTTRTGCPRSPHRPQASHPTSWACRQGNLDNHHRPRKPTISTDYVDHTKRLIQPILLTRL